MGAYEAELMDYLWDEEDLDAACAAVGDEEEFDFDIEGDDEDVVEFDFSAPAPAADERPMEIEGDGIDLDAGQRAAIDAAVDGLETRTHYEVLLLGRKASPRDVKRAYYRLSKEFHPDKFYRKSLGPYKARLEQLFNRIAEAYRVLSDPVERKDYDKVTFPELTAPPPPAPEEEVAETFVNFIPDALKKRQGRSAAGVPKAGGKGKRRRKKKEKPLFLQKLEKEMAQRIVAVRKHLNAGEEAIEKGDMVGAAREFQAAVALDPKNERAKMRLRTLQADSRNAQAEVHYREAKQAMTSEDWKSAATALKAAVECKPTRGKYYNEFGKLVLGHTIRHKTAIELLRQAVDLEGNNVDYLMDLAQAYDRQGMPSNAVRTYERILVLQPKNRAAAKALRRLK